MSKIKRFLAAALAAGLMGGCGQSQTQAAAAPKSAAESSSVVEEVKPETPSVAEGSVSQGSTPPGGGKEDFKAEAGVMGRVTAIDGSTLTLEVMRGGGRRMDKEGVSRPDGEKPDDASKPEEMPERGEAPGEGGPGGNGGPGGPGGEKPDGMPEGGPKDGGMPDGAGETLTVTLPDSCEILVEQEGQTSADTVSDIAVGSMVRIAYGDDKETVVSVTVLSAMEEPQPPADAAPPTESSTDASMES